MGIKSTVTVTGGIRPGATYKVKLRQTDVSFPATFLRYEDGKARVLDVYGQEWTFDKRQIRPQKPTLFPTQIFYRSPMIGQYWIQTGDRVKYVGASPPNILGLDQMVVFGVFGTKVEVKSPKWVQSRLFDIEDIGLI